MQHGSEVSARAPACCRYSMGSVGLTMQYSDVCVAGHPANCSQKAGGVVPSYVSFLTSLQSRLPLEPARPMPCYWCIPTSSGHVGWAHACWSMLAKCLKL